MYRTVSRVAGGAHCNYMLFDLLSARQDVRASTVPLRVGHFCRLSLVCPTNDPKRGMMLRDTPMERKWHKVE